MWFRETTVARRSLPKLRSCTRILFFFLFFLLFLPTSDILSDSSSCSPNAFNSQTSGTICSIVVVLENNIVSRMHTFSYAVGIVLLDKIQSVRNCHCPLPLSYTPYEMYACRPVPGLYTSIDTYAPLATQEVSTLSRLLQALSHHPSHLQRLHSTSLKELSQELNVHYKLRLAMLSLIVTRHSRVLLPTFESSTA